MRGSANSKIANCEVGFPVFEILFKFIRAKRPHMLVARRQSDLLVLLFNFTKRSETDELVAFEVNVPDYARDQDAAPYSERGDQCETRQ